MKSRSDCLVVTFGVDHLIGDVTIRAIQGRVLESTTIPLSNQRHVSFILTINTYSLLMPGRDLFLTSRNVNILNLESRVYSESGICKNGDVCIQLKNNSFGDKIKIDCFETFSLSVAEVPTLARWPIL
jgi:hypothetical protein